MESSDIDLLCRSVGVVIVVPTCGGVKLKWPAARRFCQTMLQGPAKKRAALSRRHPYRC
jgi:hypothetical protein